MEAIKLTRVWMIGNSLASGGFGRIYEATADDGSTAVAKLVPKVPGASRELLFGGFCCLVFFPFDQRLF
jgi:eukaryotic-like serine/threonine-protein kinase